MRSRAVGFLITVSFGSVAFAQSSAEQSLHRVFYFGHTETEQALQEITTIIRAIADIREASVDPLKQALAVRGTGAQVGLAEWLFNELDKPANRQPHAPQSRNSATHDYRMPSGSEDVVRVFYLAHAETVQDLTEVATTVRSLADLRRVFTYTVPRAVTMRGTSTQIAMAEWLINELDRPANPAQWNQPPRRNEYRPPNSSDDVARVMYLRAQTPRQFVELTTTIRALTDIRRIFNYTRPGAVAMRGTASQIALAEWLINELDRPVDDLRAQQKPTVAAYEYRSPDSSDDAVRVFYLTPGETAQDLQETAILLRTATGVRRMFIYNAPRAVVLRGTAHQAAAAERLFNERPMAEPSKVAR